MPAIKFPAFKRFFLQVAGVSPIINRASSEACRMRGIKNPPSTKK